MSLSTQTNKISGVINFPPTLKTAKDIDYFINEFKSFCGVYSREYYFIYHNRDVDSFGELKTPHLHFLIDATDVATERRRLSTHLLKICDSMNIPTNCVSVDTWRNYDSMIQYLIHKNDKDKILYKSTEIITNQTSDYLKIILERELSEKITIDYLISLIREYKKLTPIYVKLGLENSKKYRTIIVDLFKEYTAKN